MQREDCAAACFLQDTTTKTRIADPTLTDTGTAQNTKNPEDIKKDDEDTFGTSWYQKTLAGLGMQDIPVSNKHPFLVNNSTGNSVLLPILMYIDKTEIDPSFCHDTLEPLTSL